jgi:hypothetical protein
MCGDKGVLLLGFSDLMDRADRIQTFHDDRLGRADQNDFFLLARHVAISFD